MRDPNTVPVGTVLPYTGCLNTKELSNKGWYYCDGVTLDTKDYKDLYQLIGHQYGGSGNNFNIPDFQGYFLRGLSDQGDSQIGVPQTYETAGPENPFKAVVPNCPIESHEQDQNSSSVTMLRYPGLCPYDAHDGGGSETRPVNAYVSYIMSVIESAILPLGAILAYCGDNSNISSTMKQYYRLCDGSLLNADKGNYSLYAAIGVACGGNAQAKPPAFNLPDYRGRFLRGVDNGTNNDPDSPSRTAMNVGGNTGDNVGSIQGYDTALPTSNPFSIKISLENKSLITMDIVGHHMADYNDNAQTINYCSSGGDAETRPKNIYADFYVLAQSPTQSKTDLAPIGAIIGLAGKSESHIATGNSVWLSCDGTSLDCQKYPDLFAAVGTSNGGGGGTFNLPDMGGQFLRGRDGNAKIDPDSAYRTAAKSGGAIGDNVGSVQSYATAAPAPPSPPITASLHCLPTSDHQNSDIGSQHAVARFNDDPNYEVNVTGGDSETRPINYCIQFYIKASDSSDAHIR